MKQVITGNSATAYGAKLSRPGVISAYPITPQTTIVEYIANFMADGELENTQYIKVESEHSAMASCISAGIAGSRVFTATSSHGLALMHEVLMWAAGARIPMVMVNVNRAMGPPWSVWADHQDSIAQRDTGWMQVFAENNQEILDLVIQSYKIAENSDVMLPNMITQDAFYLSHTVEPVDIPEQEAVDEFLPAYEPDHTVNIGKRQGFGSLVMPDNYMEFRYKMAKAMDDSRNIIKKTDAEFGKKFGRSYGGMMEFYKCEDADYVLLGAGTSVSTARQAVDELRKEGKKVGIAKLRYFRPFPYEEVRKLASMVKGIGVFERTFTFGHGGPFYNEVMGALYNDPAGSKPFIKNYILGLGGRDVKLDDVKDVFKNLEHETNNGITEEVQWHGLLKPQEVK